MLQHDYISKTADGVLSASLDFQRFASNAEGAGAPVKISVLKLKNWAAFAKTPLAESVLLAAGITVADIAKPTWTLTTLKQLKPKALQIKLGSLRWVIATCSHSKCRTPTGRSRRERGPGSGARPVPSASPTPPSTRVVEEEGVVVGRVDRDEFVLVAPGFPVASAVAKRTRRITVFATPGSKFTGTLLPSVAEGRGVEEPPQRSAPQPNLVPSPPYTTSSSATRPEGMPR